MQHVTNILIRMYISQTNKAISTKFGGDILLGHFFLHRENRKYGPITTSTYRREFKATDGVITPSIITIKINLVVRIG